MAERDDKGRFLKKEKSEGAPEKPEKPAVPPADKPGEKKPDKPADDNERTPLETFEKIKSDMMDPAPKIKPKPKGRPKGRPKKKPAPEPPPEPEFDVDLEMLKQGIKTLFAIAERNRGPHWQLQETEAHTLAAVSDAMAQKYFPLLGPWMVELNFTFALLTIVAPRLYVDYQIRKQAAEDEAPTE